LLYGVSAGAKPQQLRRNSVRTRQQLLRIAARRAVRHKSAALMAKKKATQQPKKTTAPSRPKRKCGPPKGAVLHITSASGLRGSVAVAAGMSRNTGKPPQPYKPHKIRKSTKINPQRMLITLPRTRHSHKVSRIPTLSGASAWRDKIQQGIVTQKKKPQTLEATRRALLCMAPKHASAIANNLKYGRATYDHLFDRFKKANESETEVLRRHGREFYLPNRYFRKIGPEKWNGMMDEGKKLCRNQI
jgi:hypothetical protein